MGRIVPPRQEPGPGARAKVLLGIAAALAIAIGSYELGRRDAAPPPLVSPSRVPAARAAAPPPRDVVRPSPVAQSTDELLAEFERAHPTPPEERSEKQATVARPEPTAAAQPPLPEVTDLPETPRDKMARCLTFRAENDEVHYGGYSPAFVPLKVTASNACAFSFEGPEVSVEVRALPMQGDGTFARAIAQFQNPILPRGTSETEVLLICTRCEEVAHRFEARLPVAPR